MNKKCVGILLGLVAGLVDAIPMAMQKMTWNACLASFSMWVVVGFLIATSSLKMASAPKGILIALLVLLPATPLIGMENPMVLLIPIFPTAVLLGAFLGWSIDRLSR